jgi:hypothetical protein
MPPSAPRVIAVFSERDKKVARGAGGDMEPARSKHHATRRKLDFLSEVKDRLPVRCSATQRISPTRINSNPWPEYKHAVVSPHCDEESSPTCTASPPSARLFTMNCVFTMKGRSGV